MASTWEVSTTGGCDSLLIPRTYNDVTTNAKATEYYDNAVSALNTVLETADTVLETADTVAANAEAAATSETNAQASEANAQASATLAESWAVGGTETRDGEDTDNAKYYAEQANTDYTALDARVVALEESTATADAVAAEAAEREAADEVLQGNIDAEAATRGEADDALDSRVSALEGATSISVGEYNVAQGSGALSETTTGEYNTALGYDAMAANTTGNHNVAVGYNALAANTTGKYNVAVGYKAGCEVTDDDGNTLTAAITEGEGNIAIGWECECDGETTNDNGVCQPTTIYPSKHVDIDTSDDWEIKDSTWKKYQISVGFMHGLYFPAGTTYGDVYAAINELLPSLGYTNSGFYYYGTVSCCGYIGAAAISAICNTGTYIRRYCVRYNTSETWSTNSSYIGIKNSTSTIDVGYKLFFPSKHTLY